MSPVVPRQQGLPQGTQLQRPASRLARCQPVLAEQARLEVGSKVMPQSRMVLANLVHSRLDCFGDGGAGPFRIGTDLTVPATESDSRCQFTAEPVNFCPSLGCTG